MKRVWEALTDEVSLFNRDVIGGTVMCRIFSKEEIEIARKFFVKFKSTRPLVQALRKRDMSEQYVLRFQGKVFIMYAVEKEFRMRGAQHAGFLSNWSSLCGEYWYPEMIEYFKEYNKNHENDE